MRDVFLLLASLLAFIAHAQSQLPYNPHRIVLAKNGTLAYVFAPASSSQASLSTLDISSSFNASNAPSTVSSTLPFLSDTEQRSFIPIPSGDNITVLAGTCSQSASWLDLWQFTPSDDYTTGTWSSLGVKADNDSAVSANFLSAGVPFSPTTDSSDTALYVFGGMCPFGTALNASNWLSQSNYSDAMLTVQPLSGDAATPRYELSITSTDSSPIPEAGLTMTPLKPWFSNTSTGIISQQQDFVLLGGHTQQAFINMSQVAIFSLPQAAWTFVTIEQSESSSGELAVRDVTHVEPRSGHTAVLTEDGTRIVVLGGWVGDISTPAQPQLAILNIDQAYGGVGAWTWITPADTSSPYSDAGIYAHGAAMLPGGVMMVTGGRQISSSASKVKRDNYQDTTFFNTSSMTWSTTYVNPDTPSSSTEPAPPAKSSSETSTSSPSSSNIGRKIGLGVGIGVGLAVLLAALAIYLWFLQKRRQDRADRERQLRKVALGTDKDLSPHLDGPETHYYPERRSASWHNMQERQMESTQTNNPLLWEPTPMHLHQAPNVEMLLTRQAERTGAMMEVPSPTRGLRKNVASRAGLGFAAPPSSHAAVSGTVFRIDEEDESSQAGSIRLVRGNSIYSDPFQDPPYVADLSKSDEAAEQRKRELQGWAEDWQSAAESLNLSRNPSAATHARTYSNLSQACSQHHSSGRGSPEKSDTTESNSSDRSTDSSWQRSGTDAVGRSLSQRSASAGYALFSGAASAVSRLTGPRNSRQPDSGPTGVLSRAPSNRSVSLNVPSSTGPTVRTRDRAETFSSLQSAYGPIMHGEDQELLGKSDANRGLAEEFCTPPESPVKDKGENKYGRAGSLTRTGVKAAGLLGSVKRVFTGTGSVDVADRVANIEQRSSQPSPTKSNPAMSEVTPAPSLSTDQAFWRGKRGAKDWDEEFDRARSSSMPLMPKSQSVIRRKPVPGQRQADPEPQDPKSDDEWDIEAAVQKRVVQVMFTVPKETLRVVNADALSLISSNRSDIDHDDDRDREREISKMSSVREGDEDDQAHDDKGKQPRDEPWSAPRRPLFFLEDKKEREDDSRQPASPSSALILHRGPATAAVTIIFLSIATVFVAARFFSRGYIVRRIAQEDWWMLAAWIFSVCFSSSIVVATRYGLGMHQADIPDDSLVTLRKAQYAISVLYNPCLMLTKTSIIVFYLSVMSKDVDAVFKWLNWGTLGVVNLAGLGLTLYNILQCMPVWAGYTYPRPDTATCTDIVTLYLSSSPVNIITDVAILLLPIPILTGLRLPKKQKIILLVTFSFGIFVAVVDVVRLAYLQSAALSQLKTAAVSGSGAGDSQEGTDTSWYASFSFMWCAVEVNTGCICACVPSLKPLFLRFMPRMVKDASTVNDSIDTEPNGPNGKQEGVTFNTTSLSTAAADLSVLNNPAAFRKAQIKEYSGSDDGDNMGFLNMLAGPEDDIPNLARTTTSSSQASRRMSKKRSGSEFDFVHMTGPRNMLTLSNRESLWPLAVVTVMFLLWGIAYGLLASLNSQFQKITNISEAANLGLHTAYFGGYLIGPLTVGRFVLKRYGFRACMMAGLWIYGCGTLVFWPSAVLTSYPAFVFSNFLVAFGLSCLEIAANPYIALCGPIEYAEVRLNLSQGFQAIGTVCSPLLANKALFRNINEAGSLVNVQWAYLGISLFVWVLAIVFYYIPLPEASDDQLEEQADRRSAVNRARVGPYRVIFVTLGMGVFAQFCYVGAQECIGWFATEAITTLYPRSPLNSFDFMTVAHAVFAVGRFLTALFNYIFTPRMILLSLYIGLIVCTGVQMAVTGAAAMAIQNLLFFFEAGIFSIIFAIVLRGLGAHTKTGSALMTAAISGAAPFPLMQWAARNRHGLQISYVVPLVATFFGALFAVYLNLVPAARRQVDPVHDDRTRRREQRSERRASMASSGSETRKFGLQGVLARRRKEKQAQQMAGADRNLAQDENTSEREYAEREQFK
ncbi:hypothetical protein DV738_g3680, partial [Chaetothyriales sp. CBS 135597]